MQTKKCLKCGVEFDSKINIDGKYRNLYRRTICLSCVPLNKKIMKPLSNELPKQKKCPRCKQILSSNAFGNYHSSFMNKQVLDSLCKKCKMIKAIERMRISKERAVIYKGGKCVICGYNKCVAALEFHHIDPKLKETNFNKFQKLEKQKQELDKTILVCVNCHREIHYMNLDVSKYKSEV